jgi:single-strand DNA-binding protein
MLELNKVMVIGNLTRDPELSYIPSGMALAKMGLALNRRYKDRNGEQKEETAFLDVEAWGKTAEFCAQYLKKGRRVYVEGRLKQDRWEANDGTKRSKLTVNADRIQFADARPADQGGEVDEAPAEGPASGAAGGAPPQAGGAQRPPFPSTPAGGAQPPQGDATADDLPF